MRTHFSLGDINGSKSFLDAPCETEQSDFQIILNTLKEGVAVFDAEDRFVFWNGRYAHFYALSAAALRPGATFKSFLERGLEVGQYLDAVGRKPEWLAERLQPCDAAGRQERLPGDRWVRVLERALADGRCVRVVQDTTGVKRTETTFRLLFESNPLPMCVVDAKSLEILAVNDAAVATYGYAREDFVRMKTPDLAAPEHREGVDEIMKSDRGSYNGEEIWRHMTADGRLLLIRPYVRRLTYEGRACLLAAAVDVTDAMRAEAKLRALAGLE